MKKRLLIILIIVIFTAGLGILLYPLVSSIVNNINDRSEARQKQMEVEKMDSDKINDLFADDYIRLVSLEKAIERQLKDEILITPKVRLVAKGTLAVSDEKKAVRVRDLRKLF